MTRILYRKITACIMFNLLKIFLGWISSPGKWVKTYVRETFLPFFFACLGCMSNWLKIRNFPRSALDCTETTWLSSTAMRMQTVIPVGGVKCSYCCSRIQTSKMRFRGSTFSTSLCLQVLGEKSFLGPKLLQRTRHSIDVQFKRLLNSWF